MLWQALHFSIKLPSGCAAPTGVPAQPCRGQLQL